MQYLLNSQVQSSNLIILLMYISSETPIPNTFQIDQFPYLKLDTLNLEPNISAKRMLSIRNLTYKYSNVISKIFLYWPKVVQQTHQQQEGLFAKLALLTEIPVMPIEDLPYLLSELKQKSVISEGEWNESISQIQLFKMEGSYIVNNILKKELQMRLYPKVQKPLIFSIYFDSAQQIFRFKAAFRSLAFEVETVYKKSEDEKRIVEFADKFIVRNQAVVRVLRKKIIEKMGNLYNRQYEEQETLKLKKKMLKFYERDTKKMDQFLLQLKLKYNFPLLRQKHYISIDLQDPITKQPLSDPIISNKNKHCMYSHFIGYNSDSLRDLQNKNCQYCGILIKQVQENRLLGFLNDNIFNPMRNSIIYFPEFNRFKILIQIPEEQIAKNKLQKLQIREHEIAEQSAVQGDQIMIDQAHKQSEDIFQMRVPEKQIRYLSYPHFCSSLKSLYPLTKKRIKFQPIKQVQYVYFVYKLDGPSNFHGQSPSPQNNIEGLKKERIALDQEGNFIKSLYKYSQIFQLEDPARGKFCRHLQFVDLRMYYRNRKKKTTFCINQHVYICPICQIEVKDNQLMYLKEVLVLIKYIRKLFQPQQSVFQEKNNEKIDKTSVRIAINNVEKKIYVQYMAEVNKQIRKRWHEIDKLYSTVVDPYIYFSEYSLGLHKKSKKMQQIYNLGEYGENQKSDSQKFEQQWYGSQNNYFIL